MHVLFFYFFYHLNAFLTLVFFFSKVYIFHAFYYNSMKFDRPKMMLLKFDLWTFVIFCQTVWKVMAYKWGLFFCGHPVFARDP